MLDRLSDRWPVLLVLVVFLGLGIWQLELAATCHRIHFFAQGTDRWVYLWDQALLFWFTVGLYVALMGLLSLFFAISLFYGSRQKGLR